MTLLRGYSRFCDRMDRGQDSNGPGFSRIHCRIDASKPEYWIAGMPVREDDAIGGRDPSEITPQWTSLLGPWHTERPFSATA